MKYVLPATLIVAFTIGSASSLAAERYKENPSRMQVVADSGPCHPNPDDKPDWCFWSLSELERNATERGLGVSRNGEIRQPSALEVDMGYEYYFGEYPYGSSE